MLGEIYKTKCFSKICELTVLSAHGNIGNHRKFAIFSNYKNMLQRL